MEDEENVSLITGLAIHSLARVEALEAFWPKEGPELIDEAKEEEKLLQRAAKFDLIPEFRGGCAPADGKANSGDVNIHKNKAFKPVRFQGPDAQFRALSLALYHDSSLHPAIRELTCHWLRKRRAECKKLWGTKDHGVAPNDPMSSLASCFDSDEQWNAYVDRMSLQGVTSGDVITLYASSEALQRRIVMMTSSGDRRFSLMLFPADAIVHPMVILSLIPSHGVYGVLRERSEMIGVDLLMDDDAGTVVGLMSVIACFV